MWCLFVDVAAHVFICCLYRRLRALCLSSHSVRRRLRVALVCACGRDVHMPKALAGQTHFSPRLFFLKRVDTLVFLPRCEQPLRGRYLGVRIVYGADFLTKKRSKKKKKKKKHKNKSGGALGGVCGSECE